MKATGKWEGTVHLIGESSSLTESSHHPPINGLPFDGEDGELMVYFMSSCPGLFNGDDQSITCTIHEGAHLFLTDTSATELHPSATNDEIKLAHTFTLEKNSKLEYMPDPIIPFKGSNFNGETTIFMNKGAQAIVSEIVTAGRVGRNERFEYLCFKSSLKVYWDGKLKVWDTIKLDPQFTLNREGLFGDYTHMGSLWILSEDMTKDHLLYMQNHVLSDLESSNCFGGASFLETNGIIIRILGNSSETIQLVLKSCWDYFRETLFRLQPMVVLK